MVAYDAAHVARVRHLATQARDPAPHYQHSDIGFNYRLSNLLAAVGRGQLQNLDEKVARRRAINSRYRDHLEGVDGIEFMPVVPHGDSTNWLTCITVEPSVFGVDRESIRQRLELLDIESRPTWKPMHLQPAFAECSVVGGAVSQRAFELGLCLPSGSAMTDADVDRVAEAVLTRA
ncbi:MAG: DegT/DnrJ/EryC1/StrS family aminotransferase [Acidimicrobiales bacterium]